MVRTVKNGQCSDTVVMVFSGEYDLASKEPLRAAFDAVSKAPRVVLDFTGVTYVDSTVIHELVRIHNARAVDGLERETLVVRNENLLRIFDIVNLSAVFRVVESLDDAVAKDGAHISVHYASSFDGAAALDGSRQARTGVSP